MAIATFKTRDELVDMAADELGITSEGNTLESADQEKIDARFDGLVTELATRDVCNVASEDEIPVEWSGSLALLLADECAMIFGKPKMPEASREIVMDRLRVLTHKIEPPNRYLQADTALRGTGRYTYNRWLNDT